MLRRNFQGWQSFEHHKPRLARCTSSGPCGLAHSLTCGWELWSNHSSHPQVKETRERAMVTCCSSQSVISACLRNLFRPRRISATSLGGAAPSRAGGQWLSTLFLCRGPPKTLPGGCKLSVQGVAKLSLQGVANFSIFKSTSRGDGWQRLAAVQGAENGLEKGSGKTLWETILYGREAH